MAIEYVMASEFAAWKGPEKLEPKLHRAGNYYGLPETMEKLAGMGYGGIEVAPFTYGIPLDGDPKAIERIVSEAKAASEQHKIPITGLHWILSFLNLVDPPKEGLSIFSDGPKLTETREYYVTLIKHCVALDGKYLVHGSPGSRTLQEEVDLNRAVDKADSFFNVNVGQTYSSVLRYAENNHVRIGFEPLSTQETNFINTVGEGMYLAGRMNSSSLGATIDVKAMAAEAEAAGGGQTVPEIIRSIPAEERGKIVAVHFNDPTLTAPGLGKWGKEEFREVMRALLDIGWNGYITVEPFVQVGETTLEDCKNTIDFLKECEKGLSR